MRRQTAPKIVQGYVSQLRKVLAGEAGGQAPTGARGMLLTRPPGYVLRLEGRQLDADHFADLLARGRAALAAGGAHDASILLTEALGLWRGPPLPDFTFDSFAQEEIARLEELRLAALEEQIDADLALGRSGLKTHRLPIDPKLNLEIFAACGNCGQFGSSPP
jgi:SARP family transcriptional regulator, regulator of embCAB operon